MRPLVRLVGGALLATLAACGSDRGTGPADGPPPPLEALPRALTAPEHQAIRAGNAFGLALLREVAAREPGRNVVLSPFSAAVALGMAYAGAGGLTADSMRLALGWGGASRAEVLAGYRDLPALLAGLDPRVEVRSANGLWVRTGFPVRPAYTTEMQQVFAAQVRTSDFGPTAVAAMNAWASQATNGRITRVVETLPPELVAMLMNALHFKGAWRERFDTARTHPEPFTTAAGTRPLVPMMHRSGNLAFTRLAGAQVVELPYGNGAWVMTLALPAAGTTPRAWLDGLDAAQLATGLASLRTTDVDLALPRFRLALDFQLRDALTALGMGRAFAAGRADFSGVGEGELVMTHVTQDVFIDVDEAGTEAAAVTQVGIGVTSVPQREVVRLDRPFVFFVRERLSGTILFAGLLDAPGA